jgi:hypothetical protein
MAKVALSKEFQSGFHKLNSDVHKKVLSTLGKFGESSDSGGLNLESYHAAADPRARTIRVDKFWRAILAAPEDGDGTYILFAVKPHDDADRWMAKNRFSVNALTKGLEVIADEDVRSVAKSDSLLGPEAPEKGLLADLPDKAFKQLGITDEGLIDLVKAIPDEDQLLAMANVLPDAQAEAVMGLMCGESVEEIWAKLTANEAPATAPDVLEPVPEGEQNLGEAVETPGSRSSFQVVDGSDELALALAGDFEAWRTFLHPAQLAVVERNYNGPARITGGAGTGKTVALLHRAKRLADEGGPDTRILVTTFTNKLTGDLSLRLKELGGPELAERVEVSTVDRLARGIASDGDRVDIASPRVLHSAIEDAFDTVGLDQIGLTSDFLQQEWEQVVLGRKVQSRDEYFSVSRAGRGVRLNRRKRAEVWRAVEAIETSLDARGKKTFLQVADQAADQLRGAAIKPFDHVLVDESQDLHPAQWRLLRAVVAESPDDLFIAGDTHQRIYDNRVSLKQLGIDIRGRSSRLKLNYRTTRQILNWSLRLIVGERFDDLDDGEETLLGYRSATEGPEPEIERYSNFGAELEGLVEAVQGWRDAGVEPEEVGICARTNATAEQARGALEGAGLPVSSSGSGGGGVHVGTMHGMKGLEFRCVAMIDLSASSVPPASAITPAEEDPLSNAQDLQRERCLLYVAATRARETLYMSHTGGLTRLMGSSDSSSWSEVGAPG